MKQANIKGLKDIIDTASNGLDALQLVKKGFNDMMYSYGLILMDLSMPKMNGFDSSY